ncbi:unnamed protein product [Closterium sp. Naga37s-1]|nr:unnamed protein product [Closterium sp. Naga37s-1]
MASAGISSMGNGKPCVRCSPSSPSSPVRSVIRSALSPRALMRHRAHAVMRSMHHSTARTRDGCPTNSLLRPCPSHATCRSLAACLPQPSQAAAAASVSVPVPIGTPMTINGRTFKFSPRRCVNLPAMSPSQKARVVVPWQQASMSGKAMCRAIWFFQDPACKGQTFGRFREWPTEVRLPFLLALLPCSYALDAARLLPHLINDRCTRGALPPLCAVRSASPVQQVRCAAERTTASGGGRLPRLISAFAFPLFPPSPVPPFPPGPHGAVRQTTCVGMRAALPALTHAPHPRTTARQ